MLRFHSRHHYYEWLCPRGTHRYFHPYRFFCLDFSLRILPTGSQVPSDRLYKAHAAYTPDATGTVNSSSSLLIIKCYCTLLLTSSNPFEASSAVHFHSSSLYLPDTFYGAFSSNAHYQGSLPKQLRGSLMPAPVCPHPGAFPHQSDSIDLLPQIIHVAQRVNPGISTLKFSQIRT